MIVFASFLGAVIESFANIADDAVDGGEPEIDGRGLRVFSAIGIVLAFREVDSSEIHQKP